MISIFVPYRNRKNHLDIFIHRMIGYLPDAKIFVGEQVDDKPFNRGKLLNILFLETKPEYLVAHDVDMVPIAVDYKQSEGVTQLASSDIQTVGYLGGVTMFSKATFERLGGYNNGYFSRAEDNEVAFNLKRLRIEVKQRHGYFEQLPHERNGPEFDSYLWRLAQQRRVQQNQLSVCRYKVVGKEQKKGYTLIKVEL